MRRPSFTFSGVLMVVAFLTMHGWAAPMTQLWRSDLANISSSVEYSATTATLDESGSLFVGGSVKLARETVSTFPFVAKFNSTGVKVWEYWTTANLTNLTTVEAIAPDERGGAFFAFRNRGGGVQLAWTLFPLGINPEYLSFITNAAVFEPFSPARNVSMAGDGTNGFFLSYAFFAGSNSLPKLCVSRYDSTGNLLWQTNLFDNWANYGRGVRRSLLAGSNGVFAVGFDSNTVSRLAKLSRDGSVDWVRESGTRTIWDCLATLDSGEICVSGSQNYQVFSDNGDRLASHLAWDSSSVAEPFHGDSRFLVCDWAASSLTQPDSNGLIRAIGQLPFPTPYSKGELAMVGIATNEWLAAANCTEFLSPYTNNLSFFCVDATGAVKWRQRAPGFEYDNDYTANHWLLRAKDGTLRLVVNLNNSSANLHRGVAVAAFSLTGSIAGPMFTNLGPLLATNGPAGVTLTAQATGAGNLRYQWFYFGEIFNGQTSATLEVPNNMSLPFVVRVTDDNGEIISPAMRVRAADRSPLQIDVTSTFGPVVSAPSDYGIQVRFDVSTNLHQWQSEPTVYSVPVYWPTAAISHILSNSSAGFIRSVEVP